MKVLVACEESQRVCTEFRKLGHEAYSCDIEPCSGGHPEWHIKCDVMRLINGYCIFTTMDGKNHYINDKWDMIIAFPPCTYLTNAGTRHFSLKCSTPKKIEKRLKLREEAAEFFMQFANADCDKIAIENPVGYMNGHWRKADQIIHPYYFAKSKYDTENYHQKRTCLWLKGLHKLNKVIELPKPEPMYICEGEKCKGKKSDGAKVCVISKAGRKKGQKQEVKHFLELQRLWRNNGERS